MRTDNAAEDICHGEGMFSHLSAFWRTHINCKNAHVYLASRVKATAVSHLDDKGR